VRPPDQADITDPDSEGRLPASVIQRIVRQSYGRFRPCYEAALGRNPGLTGSISVRFVIACDGSVSHASSADADLPADVVRCIVRAYYGLSFPEPEGGIVTVTYPMVFSSS
jgi:hypothetical protein